MEITVEISYYPLQNDYDSPVLEFIQELSKNKNLQMTTGTMSTFIAGEYEEIMTILKESMKPFLEKYPSVFRISIASACKTCKQ